MQKHDVDEAILFCRQCGISKMEFVRDGEPECTGTSGVVSIKYLRARKRAGPLFMMADEVLTLRKIF